MRSVQSNAASTLDSQARQYTGPEQSADVTSENMRSEKQQVLDVQALGYIRHIYKALAYRNGSHETSFSYCSLGNR